MASTRRLTAILAADVAGYSRLMGADEEGTHERLKGHFRGTPQSSGRLCARPRRPSPEALRPHHDRLQTFQSQVLGLPYRP
jgi:hypothetical protein